MSGSRRTHLSERPEDWETATHAEWVAALLTLPSGTPSEFMSYAERNRAEAVCDYLIEHEKRGGVLLPPDERFIEWHKS